MLEYQSISALCAAAEEAGVSLSELVLRDQAEEMELLLKCCTSVCGKIYR